MTCIELVRILLKSNIFKKKDNKKYHSCYGDYIIKK